MNDKERQRRLNKRRLLKIFISVAALLALLILIIVNSASLHRWFTSVLQLFRPILLGLALAYLLNPVFRVFERRFFRNMHPLGLRRTLSLICAYLVLFLLLALLLSLIIPQLVVSISDFVADYPSYLESNVNRFNRFVEWLNRLLARFNASQDFIRTTTTEEFTAYVGRFLTGGQLVGMLRSFIGSGGIGNVVNSVGGVISFVANLIFTFFISLYLLSTKEKRYAQVMRFRRAFFSDPVNAAITRVCTVADRSFGSFLEGKFFDSLIIGILCYLVLLIFRIPYPVLLAVIIGITNIVPVIGPLFGAIPTAIIVLLTEPTKVIPFLLIVLVIQQIDGNIIGPKILGNSNGVSSLCVLVSITIMGNILGLVGTILSVPLFATVIELLRDVLENRLRKKGLPSATENYYPGDSSVDPAQDMQSSSEKSLRRLERHVLHLRALSARGIPLKRTDRMILRFYEWGRRTSIFSDFSPETLMLFAVEEAVRTEETALRRPKG